MVMTFVPCSPSFATWEARGWQTTRRAAEVKVSVDSRWRLTWCTTYAMGRTITTDETARIICTMQALVGRGTRCSTTSPIAPKA